MGILQVLRLKFRNFRILEILKFRIWEILNFYPCFLYLLQIAEGVELLRSLPVELGIQAAEELLTYALIKLDCTVDIPPIHDMVIILPKKSLVTDRPNEVGAMHFKWLYPEKKKKKTSRSENFIKME